MTDVLEFRLSPRIKHLARVFAEANCGREDFVPLLLPHENAEYWSTENSISARHQAFIAMCENADIAKDLIDFGILDIDKFERDLNGATVEITASLFLMIVTEEETNRRAQIVDEGIISLVKTEFLDFRPEFSTTVERTPIEAAVKFPALYEGGIDIFVVSNGSGAIICTDVITGKLAFFYHCTGFGVPAEDVARRVVVDVQSFLQRWFEERILAFTELGRATTYTTVGKFETPLWQCCDVGPDGSYSMPVQPGTVMFSCRRRFTI